MQTIADLKALPQWVGYTAQKVPMNPHTGRAASSTDPATWATAAEAWAARKRHSWAGIGYVFTIEAGVIGVDLDDCYDADGKLSDTAAQVVSCLDSYTERSPSGRGLHILARGTIPHSVKQAGFEMYNEARYFTVTGNRLRAYSANIEERPAELLALFVTFGGDIEPEPRPLRQVSPEWATTDEAAVRKALATLPTHGDYNTFWLPVLMAVHSAFPDQRGIDMIEAWSPGYAGEVARKWRSFDNRGYGEGQGIGIGTLFHMAKQYGYQAGNGKANGQRPQRISHDEKLAALLRA
jgi:hypothetical protein